MFDDPRKKLEWLNQELLDEEEEYEEWEDEEEDEEEDGELGPGYNYAVDFGRTIFADEEAPRELASDGKPRKKKGTRGLRYLLLMEIFGILAVIGWWLKWLI